MMSARWHAMRFRGATAVELLILLVLLIILAAIAIPNVSPVVQWYRLRGAAWQLSGDLRLARQRAVTTQKRFRLCVTRCAISVPAGSYSMERDDGTPSDPLWISEFDVTVRLPSGVTVSATATPTFNPTGTGSGSTFTVTNLIGTYAVVVHPTGRVRVCQGVCSP
jgi:Tfp pilus assembly protein FimT